MSNINTPINLSQRLMNESDRNQSSSNKIHTCPSHLTAGFLSQQDFQSKQAQQVYCDACIIQFYHRSNTFLSNFSNMSSIFQLNQNGNSFTKLGQKTIDTFNNSLMLPEHEDLRPNFIMDCTSNCKERNKEITMQQQQSQKAALLYLQNMQQNNPQNIQTNNMNYAQQNNYLFQQNSSQPSQKCQPNNYIFPNLQIQDQQGQFALIQAQKNSSISYNYQTPDAYRYSNQSDVINMQAINNFNINNNKQQQCSMQQGQQQRTQNSCLQQLNDQFSNQGATNNSFYSNQIQQINQLNTPQYQFDELNHQARNFSINGQNPLPSIQQQPIDIQYQQQNRIILQNQQQYQEMFQHQQQGQDYNHILLSNLNSLSSNFNNQQNNKNIVPSDLQLQNGLNSQKQNGGIISFEFNIEQRHSQQRNLLAQQNLNQQFQTSQQYQFEAAAQIFEADIQVNASNEKQLVVKPCGLKKINQQIKHANKQNKLQTDAHTFVGQTEYHLRYKSCDEEFIDEEDMNLVLEHEYQQELYSKKRRQQNKKQQQDVSTTEKQIKKQSHPIKSGQALGKSKELEKKKSEKSKKQQQSYVVSSRWCPQSQQLLFEWNNTPLKQIQLQSDKIVNESVNVASYVNILNKNRIMIISQNTRSLKYQINLIDLQENKVICKNQLGSNFQLFPFEPSKLKVQTVKINERVSCIYLMGGSYFKIIKNSSLKNVKRVKQFCIQQILPIYKGRQVVALSLNGLINIYSTAQDRFHLIKSMKIQRESPISISYVNYFDVDTENSLIYCCVLSNNTQFIQIFNMFTGDIIYTQDIHILQQNYGYNITNMKIFQNYLYIELQLQQHEQHGLGQNGCEMPIQFKVQAYKIDNQSHHLNEFKTYNHSNILKSTFSSQQFFLYNSQKSCIIGFEKLNQKKYKHYLTSSSLNQQLCLPNQQINQNLGTAESNEQLAQINEEKLNSQIEDNTVNQKIFKLNIKQTSPNFRPIFTHIFKEIPHGYQFKQRKQIASICDEIPNYQQSLTVAQNYQSELICESEINHIQNNQDMVLTLFDQNKNVYKIYQN